MNKIKNFIIILSITFITLFFSNLLINVKADDTVISASGSIELDCPKSQLNVSETMTCSIKVTNSFYEYNVVKIHTYTNGDGNFEGKNEFEFKQAYSGVACEKCIGRNCKCQRNRFFISQNLIATSDTRVVGTITIEAPETEGTLLISYPASLGVADYNEFDPESPVYVNELVISNLSKTITVVKPQEPEVPKTTSVILDCPKTTLKYYESMDCELKVTNLNTSYNAIIFNSYGFRNLEITGKNGFQSDNSASCKKCPYCGCSGFYYLTNENIVSENGTTLVGIVTVTAPGTSGNYNLLFRDLTVGISSNTSGKPNFSETIFVGNISKAIDVVADTNSSSDNPSTPVENPTIDEPVLSGDNSLSLLELYSNDELLSIDFNQNRTVYNIVADGSVAAIKIVANLNSDTASFVEGFGPREVSINYGYSTFYIKVKAENGNIATYTINVSRTADDVTDSPIKSITINGETVNVVYGTYDYYFELGNNVKYTNISVDKKDDSILVNYSNINLVEGNNTLIMRVLDESGNYYIYSLTIYRKESSSSNISTYILIGLTVVVVLAIICVVAPSFKKRK